uniref:Uncharacterized protein n=1 Tax=viral metagenome TaxID=1070528 RepID=A0A6C0KQQ2_9ZZZZ
MTYAIFDAIMPGRISTVFIMCLFLENLKIKIDEDFS